MGNLEPFGFRKVGGALPNDTPVDRLILRIAADYDSRNTHFSPSLIYGELEALAGRAERGDITFGGRILRSRGMPSFDAVARSVTSFARQYGFIDRDDPSRLTELGRYITHIEGPYNIPFRETVPAPDAQRNV